MRFLLEGDTLPVFASELVCTPTVLWPFLDVSFLAFFVCVNLLTDVGASPSVV